ncbi:transforming growth factor-beta-induced protein ig-h3-like [Mytilus californianus]|uniref:transforming growth factor-beta-induced protein ig-h3-like n=1 Tax=Mytilus californianus TaxID=6549 RepID=UPI002247BC06|nr:transforming growth factor-beta-induced protein ig-h3-like [Mytilus californianus]
MKILLVIFAAVISANCNPCQFYDLLTCADFLGSWKFVELCEKAHVTHEFTKGNDSKTLFLPSRGALDSIPSAIMEMMSKNKTFLKETIMYHLVPQKLQCNNMKDNSLLPTFQGEQLRVNRYTSEQDNKTLITVEGGEYMNVEDRTKNGRICVIHHVLYQIPTKTAYKYISEDRNVSTFLLLASKAQDLDTFKGPNMTVLVPDNAAFSKLAPGVLQNITSNPELLKGVLSNHMADEVFFTEGLTHLRKFTAKSGTSFPVDIKEREVYIGSAKIINADVPTLNGVVQIIDTVLVET